MILKRNFLIIFTLAALAGCLADQARAERLFQRTANANNLGLGMVAEWGGPLRSGGNPFQYPGGSGNFITNDVWLWNITLTRDIDGDGVPEDTMRCNKNSMSCYGGLNEDILIEYKAKGLNMETATSNRGGTDISQVWSSLDPDAVATWPWEAREPKGPNGTPVIKGAETLVAFSSDVFNGWYTELLGFFMCYNLYFLNFGEANDMAFCHIWLQNSTHYFKYNNAVESSYGAQFPNGIKWHEFTLTNNQRFVEMGGTSCGWALHPAEGLVVHFSQDPTVASFTPQEPPQLGWKMLRAPRFKDQEMKMTNMYTWGGGEFGMVSTRDMMTGYNVDVTHLLALGEYDPFPGVVHPYTGETPMRGWPGVPSEDSEWYNKWLWGGYTGNTYTSFSRLTDFEPKDSLSFDWVIIVTPAEGKTVTMPERTVANIESSVMQEAFSMQLDYSAAAQEVFAGGLRSPETPRPPPLTIIPGDREVTLTWSDINPKTPDSFYYYLEENNFNQEGYYREYDFEGYRLYRSFVGPSDSHSDLLADFSMSAGNIRFHYVDNDKEYYESTGTLRIQNGMKIWYALVPYDKNYNPVTGEPFSLPDPQGGKTWYGAGKAEFNVNPRSEASEFKVAELEGTITYTPAYGTPVFDDDVTIAGNGDGTFAEAPKYRAPVASFQFQPIINERITTEKTITVTPVVESWKTTQHAWGCYHNKMKFQLQDGGSVASETGEFDLRKYTGRPGDVSAGLNSAISDAGPDYAVSAEFKYLSDGNFRSQMVVNLDAGGYTGGTAKVMSTHSSRIVAYPPGIIGQMRPARITMTWGAGTLTVVDETRGYTLPFVEYQDQDYGWGLVTKTAYGGAWDGQGQLFTEMMDGVPFAQRTAKMVQSLPTDNTEEFGIWANGVLYVFQGEGGVLGGMPAAGTVMTADNVFGSWNGAKTVFTQFREPPWPGDKWEFKVKPSTMNPEDIDLSKISVVPNPYIGTSFLDLSPSSRRIEFINLPARCTIRIYSLGGNLVNVLNHIGANRQGWGNYTTYDRAEGAPKTYTGYDNHGGTEPWNLRNRFGQTVASGLYFYHVTDSRGETYTGKFYVVI